MTLAVIFDMDGLMLDTERLARAAWRRAMQDKGFEIEDAIYLLIVGRTIKDAQKILAEAYGPDFPFQEVYDLRQTYYDDDLTINGVPVKQGLLELLDFLDAHHIPKAVASSTHRKFAGVKLTGAGIAARFDAAIFGDEVINGKPAPDLFLEAARLLRVSPRECVVLEDFEAGVRAAYAAGMLPVMIPDLKQPSPDVSVLTYRIVPSLEEVVPILEKLLEKGSPEPSLNSRFR